MLLNHENNIIKGEISTLDDGYKLSVPSQPLISTTYQGKNILEYALETRNNDILFTVLNIYTSTTFPEINEDFFKRCFTSFELTSKVYFKLKELYNISNNLDIFIVLKEKNTKIAKDLLSSGAPINVKDNKSRLPLIYMLKYITPAQDEYTDLFTTLSNGININQRDIKGKIPIMYAKNKFELESLLALGGDIYLKDNKGWNTLHHLCRKCGDIFMFNYFLNIYEGKINLLTEKGHEEPLNIGRLPVELVLDEKYNKYNSNFVNYFKYYLLSIRGGSHDLSLIKNTVVPSRLEGRDKSVEEINDWLKYYENEKEINPKMIKEFRNKYNCFHINGNKIKFY